MGNCQFNQLSPGFPKEVLEEISTAAHVTTFEDRVTFVKTLQRHRGEFDLLLQHMSESGKALLADVGKRPPLCKNINVVTMLTRDVLLCHFRKT